MCSRLFRDRDSLCLTWLVVDLYSRSTARERDQDRVLPVIASTGGELNYDTRRNATELLVTWETPRLCRGDSRSLTVPAVCSRNRRRRSEGPRCAADSGKTEAAPVLRMDGTERSRCACGTSSSYVAGMAPFEGARDVKASGFAGGWLLVSAAMCNDSLRVFPHAAENR